MSTPKPIQRKGRILVIDDDLGILEAIEMMLQEAGYETETSSKNGEYIEQTLQREIPGLIILDILLSGHDGREICKLLKSQEMTRHIPVILISAHPNAFGMALEVGADDFLGKPFNIDDLLEKVERYI